MKNLKNGIFTNNLLVNKLKGVNGSFLLRDEGTDALPVNPT